MAGTMNRLPTPESAVNESPETIRTGNTVHYHRSSVPRRVGHGGYLEKFFFRSELFFFSRLT